MLKLLLLLPELNLNTIFLKIKYLIFTFLYIVENFSFLLSSPIANTKLNFAEELKKL